MGHWEREGRKEKRPRAAPGEGHSLFREVRDGEWVNSIQ